MRKLQLHGSNWRCVLTIACASMISCGASASCECEPSNAATRAANARWVFIATVSSARLETIREGVIYRMPGHLTWEDGENLTEEEKKIAEESKEWKQSEIWAKFESVKFYKGTAFEIKEMRMGDFACPMNVTVGHPYVIYSSRFQSTDDCEGSIDLLKYSRDERDVIMNSLKKLTNASKQ